jgi:luciferase family oxidoreductase group 1
MSTTQARPTPLNALDVITIPEGGDAAGAITASTVAAGHAERAGYRRYLLTEHHLNAGIAGGPIPTLLPLFAERTERIRVGTAATLLGNYRLVQVAETFGALAALYPDRIDLGLGRSGAVPASTPEFPKHLTAKLQLQRRLFGRTDGDTTDLAALIAELRDFFAGTSVDAEAGPFVAPPATAATPQLWVHGTSAGISARVAGALGLPFGSNYHTSPRTTLDAIAEYRAAFRPSATLAAPYVMVSADVIVGDTDAAAQRAAKGYGNWVASIRAGRGQGAIPYPSTEWADAHPLDDDDFELVADRLATRIVGAPEPAAAALAELATKTGADELLIAVETHDASDRVAALELLAEAWRSVEASPSLSR